MQTFAVPTMYVLDITKNNISRLFLSVMAGDFVKQINHFKDYQRLLHPKPLRIIGTHYRCVGTAILSQNCSIYSSKASVKRIQGKKSEELKQIMGTYLYHPQV